MRRRTGKRSFRLVDLSSRRRIINAGAALVRNAVQLNVNVNVNVDVDVKRQPSPQNADTTHMFGFQRLDVYKCAVRFLALAMKRASVGASGTGRFGKDQRRFYITARGSALECAAILAYANRVSCWSESYRC